VIFLEKIQELNSGVVVFRDEKILILERQDGIWEFPGGSVDWGESPEEAAKREVKEETGLLVGNLEFLTVTSAVYEKEDNFTSKHEKHSVYIVYRGESTKGEVELSKEHKSSEWVSVEKAKKMKLGLNVRPAIEIL